MTWEVLGPMGSQTGVWMEEETIFTINEFRRDG